MTTTPAAITVYATIDAGSVEYNLAEAAVDIDDLIRQLETARDDGATHVVGLSGNYRGARYVSLGSVDVCDLDEDD